MHMLGIHFKCLPSKLMHLIGYGGCDKYHQLNFISKCTTVQELLANQINLHNKMT